MEIGCITKEVRFGKERLAETDLFIIMLKQRWLSKVKQVLYRFIKDNL